MAIVHDDYSENLSLPLPHVENGAASDVARIRQALVLVDTAIQDASTASAALATRIDGVDTSITSLQTAVSAAQSTADSATAQAQGLAASRGAAGGIATLDNDGFVPLAQLPAFAADKITSGTLAVDRIPGLAVAKITSGSFAVARGGTGRATLTANAFLVGNGTTAIQLLTPAQALTSIGALPLAGGAVTGALSVGGGLSVTGDVTATGNVSAYSDARLKSNIAPITGALDKVGRLRGVTYRMDGRDGVGLVAQEVQAVMPQAVADVGGYLAVAYGNLVGLLVSAINELADEVAALRADRS